MVKVNSRIAEAPQQLIKVIAADTAQLLARGAPLLDLSQGSPNLPMFEPAFEAAAAELATRKLSYTAVPGRVEVRQACADFLNRVVLGMGGPRKAEESNGGGSAEATAGGGGGGGGGGGCSDSGASSGSDTGEGVYGPEHICVTNGAVQACFHALALSVEGPDDVVVSPLPAYGLYAGDTAILGGTFVALRCGGAANGFGVRPADIDRAFAEHGGALRVLVLSAPNNPMGRCWSDAEARALAQCLERQRACFPDSFSVVLDEVYTGIEASHVSLLRHATPALRRCCFFAASVSKGLGGAPGARAGFLACADPDLMVHVTKLQMATSANVSVLSQEILRASMEHVVADPAGVLGAVREHYHARTSFVCEQLRVIHQGIVSTVPQGAFYVVANFKCLGLSDDVAVQRCLRDAYRVPATGGKAVAKFGVAVVPLSAFGMPAERCLVRLCCAVDMGDLRRAMHVIESVVWARCS